MAGICSKHKYYNPNCDLCKAIFTIVDCKMDCSLKGFPEYCERCLENIKFEANEEKKEVCITGFAFGILISALTLAIYFLL